MNERRARRVSELSLAKQRVYAYLYVPDDAPVEDVRGWLASFPLSPEVVSAICIVHSGDEILREWRVERRLAMINSIDICDN